ncbi:MAG: EscU/YscU/HrcU family type III secretion system export apparatus switch protein [Bacillota bacterium]|jgi:flagellar biosynthesis protein
MEKTPKAAALCYDRDKDQAPVVVAAGVGQIAKNIEKTARDHHVPVYKDEKLAQALTDLSIGVEVPEELYIMVAQVLVYVAKTDKEFRRKVLK